MSKTSAKLKSHKTAHPHPAPPPPSKWDVYIDHGPSKIYGLSGKLLVLEHSIRHESPNILDLPGEPLWENPKAPPFPPLHPIIEELTRVAIPPGCALWQLWLNSQARWTWCIPGWTGEELDPEATGEALARYQIATRKASAYLQSRPGILWLYVPPYGPLEVDVRFLATPNGHKALRLTQSEVRLSPEQVESLSVANATEMSVKTRTRISKATPLIVSHFKDDILRGVVPGPADAAIILVGDKYNGSWDGVGYETIRQTVTSEICRRLERMDSADVLQTVLLGFGSGRASRCVRRRSRPVRLGLCAAQPHLRVGRRGRQCSCRRSPRILRDRGRSAF